jgi:predicted PurR-regulated permease PerM
MKERKGLVPLSFCSYIRSMDTLIIILTVGLFVALIGCSIALIQIAELRSTINTLYQATDVRDKALHQLLENGREQEKLNNIVIQAISELQEGEIEKAMMFGQKMGEA